MSVGKHVADAMRSVARSPRQSVPVMALLAMGIAVNAVLFAVADAVLFRPFPFADPAKLVIAGENLISPRSEIPYREFVAWREQTRTLDDLAAIGSTEWSWRLRTGTGTISVRYRAVSGHFFDLLGTRARLGR